MAIPSLVEMQKEPLFVSGESWKAQMYWKNVDLISNK